MSNGLLKKFDSFLQDWWPNYNTISFGLSEIANLIKNMKFTFISQSFVAVPSAWGDYGRPKEKILNLRPKLFPFIFSLNCDFFIIV